MANTPNNQNTSKKFDKNEFCITGRLTKDPEIRANTSGQYGMFTIANNRGENTNFFTFFVKENQIPFLSQYLHKGCLVDVTGTVLPSTDTMPDGSKKTNIKLIVSKMGLVGVPGQGSTPTTNSNFANNYAQPQYNNYSAPATPPIAQPPVMPQMQNVAPAPQQQATQPQYGGYTPSAPVTSSYDDDDLPF